MFSSANAVIGLCLPLLWWMAWTSPPAPRVEAVAVTCLPHENPYFPAQPVWGEDFFTVRITVEMGAPFQSDFKHYDLYGNGYCWSSIVEQLMLEKTTNLTNRVRFDPEADVCTIVCPNKKAMFAVADFIHRHLGDSKGFQAAMATVDRSKLDC